MVFNVYCAFSIYFNFIFLYLNIVTESCKETMFMLKDNSIESYQEREICTPSSEVSMTTTPERPEKESNGEYNNNLFKKYLLLLLLLCSWLHL